MSIIAYNPFHVDRNVASASTLSAFRANRQNFHWLTYPSAELDTLSNLVVKMVPVFSGGDGHVAELSRQHLIQIEVAILKEIDKLASRHGITVVLAVQSGGADDPVVRYVGGVLGWDVVFVGPEKEGEHDLQRYTLWPVDDHPSEVAHQKYAEKLVPILRKTIRPEAALGGVVDISFVVGLGDGAQQRVLSVSNPTDAPFDLKAVPSEHASSWLSVSPETLHLVPNQRGDIIVTASPPFDKSRPDGAYIQLSKAGGGVAKIPVRVLINKMGR